MLLACGWAFLIWGMYVTCGPSCRMQQMTMVVRQMPKLKGRAHRPAAQNAGERG